MQVGRGLGVLQCEEELEEAGDAGCSLQMANVGLESPHNQRQVVGPRVFEDGHDGSHLDGVPERGARSVGFDVVDVTWPQASHLQSRSDHFLLGRAIGSSEARTPAVVIDCAAANVPQHRPALTTLQRICLCRCCRVVMFVIAVSTLLVGLDDHSAAPLASCVAVGFLVEGLASRVHGEHAGLGEGNEEMWREHQVDASHQEAGCPSSVWSEHVLDARIQGHER
mmetsp:Transcript_16425/g.39409  ORF Transcript_16425/g.39409 Transcript_16425/m.39409 type:complete len:224 (+) Transcript_16425:269-940(+)